MRFDWSKYWSIRLRLVVLYLGIFGSTLILFCSLLYRSFVNNQQSAFDIALYNHAVDISQGIQVSRYGNLTVSGDILSPSGKIFPFAAGSVYVQIYSLDGTELGRSRNLGTAHLPLSQKDRALLFQSRGIFETFSAKDLHLNPEQGQPKQFRLLTALAPGQSQRNFILQVAVPETLLTQVTHHLKQFLWISIPFTLIAATFGGLYLSRKALTPIRDIIKKANNLSPEHLSERIPVPPAQDEIRSLALTLNALLDRLQHAFESQERFIADASHELKTPLAILKGELEVFRTRPRNEEETSLFLTSALQELNYLSRVVEDLLVLARVDAGASVLNKSPVMFEEIVLDVVSMMETISRHKDVKMRMILPEESISVSVDSDLLKILIKNLIENAIKFSPPSQVVKIVLSSDSKWASLHITDQGKGISKEHIPKIFQRFYREPGISKNREHPGAGLGLAIAQRIAEIHDSKIEVHSTPDISTTFTFKIKKF